MKIWKGELETRSWSFESYGRTSEEARKALKRAWLLHVRYTGATLKWKDLWEGGEAVVYDVDVGRGYRDREPMW